MWQYEVTTKSGSTVTTSASIHLINSTARLVVGSKTKRKHSKSKQIIADNKKGKKLSKQNKHFDALSLTKSNNPARKNIYLFRWVTLTERWRNPMWGELFCQRWASRIGNMRWNHITLGKILKIGLKFSIIKFIEPNLFCYSPQNFLCLLCDMLDWFDTVHHIIEFYKSLCDGSESWVFLSLSPGGCRVV